MEGLHEVCIWKEHKAELKNPGSKRDDPMGFIERVRRVNGKPLGERKGSPSG